VANVSQVLTVDKFFLTEKAGKVRKSDLQKIESGLRLVMGL
jgi:mRNA-degrading endonuclease toxin of MazEF toxin-antitoxin module